MQKVQKPRGRYSWLIYSLISVGVAVILLLCARFFIPWMGGQGLGGRVSWATAAPVSVVVAVGSVSAAVYANYRSDRR